MSSGIAKVPEWITESVEKEVCRIYVDGIEVWENSPEHTYTYNSGGYSENYLGDGCDSCEMDCANGNCDSFEGPSLGSLKFRIPLGSPVKGQISGFVWFSMKHPEWIDKNPFNLLSHPDASISETNSSGIRRIISNDSRGRALAQTQRIRACFCRL